MQQEQMMGKNNKKCPRCGHKMKQQFIGLQHCSCGMSWKGAHGRCRVLYRHAVGGLYLYAHGGYVDVPVVEKQPNG